LVAKIDNGYQIGVEVIMSERSKYNTRQREILIDYLETVPRAHITISDVCEYFKTHGSPMGQATIYRQMEKLVDDGLVSKYIFDSNSPACFEYIGNSEHVSDGNCFHCKCEKCGALIHMHCDELSAIKGHLFEEHGFSLDPFRTVFYGICKDCREKE